MNNDKPDLLAFVTSRDTSQGHSVHLSKLTDEQLACLHDYLVYECDAHRETRFEIGGRRGRKISEQIREYFKAVKIEQWSRAPGATFTASRSRYETRRPIDVLKRAATACQTGGSVSLATLQNEYVRLHRGRK